MNVLIGLLLLIFSATALAGNVLYENTTLYMNEGLISPEGKYSLWMQNDGNLVLYRKDGSVRWTAGKKGLFAQMQGDGNFVLYASSSFPQFNTRTEGNPGAALVLQDDGNLVIYAPYGRGAFGGSVAIPTPRHVTLILVATSWDAISIMGRCLGRWVMSGSGRPECI